MPSPTLLPSTSPRRAAHLLTVVIAACVLAQIRDRSDELRAELTMLERRGAKAQRRMTAQVRSIYKGDRINGLMALATGESLAEIGRRGHYLTAMTRGEREDFEAAAALARATQSRRAELAEVDGRLDELVAEADAAREELDARFLAAGATQQDLTDEIARREAEARRLAEEAAARRRAAREAQARSEAAEAARQLAQAEVAERRAAAASRSADRARAEAESAPAAQPASSVGGGSGGSSSGSGGGGKVCPQANPRSFTDTWGAPRSGGRTHQGTDIFGARGGNVYAITSGTVQWTQTGSSSGLFLSLRGNDGHTYWYMHLQDFVAREGQQVAAGDLIAHNGDTGNARGTTPHIHFEYHPGGGSAVNPYPMLREVCG
jgi:murein DD-endopeptidase MepM/ murein hydrolase activator NlpD